MRGGEHEVGRQRGAGAQVVARIHDHHDGARGPARRRRRIAGNGRSGGGEQQEADSGEDAEHGVHEPWLRNFVNSHPGAGCRRTEGTCEPSH